MSPGPRWYHRRGGLGTKYSLKEQEYTLSRTFNGKVSFLPCILHQKSLVGHETYVKAIFGVVDGK